jgi:GNAT superfamily N-acetyltransferase
MGASSSASPLDQWASRLRGKPRPDLRRALKWSPNLDALVHPTFAQTPDALKTRFHNPSGIYLDSDGHVHIYVVVDWTDDGEEFGWADVYINGETRVCEFENLRLVEGEQRSGFGRAYLEALVDLCRELGIGRIDINAEDAGRYVWARLGFAFQKGPWRNDVVKAAKKFAEALGVEVPFDLDTVKLPSEIANLRGEVSFEDIARAQGARYSGEPGKTVPLGEALLLYAPYIGWFGTMDLTG